ncbi:probable serine/threonine-protein kinase At1g54610 isoform X1 [Phoenix dactylifera]|uniref:[RNA-polymerase]-subunit kinase n=1 Tax=Phoenix dactylifera TaxID=42345 RepID=A0A8B7CH00_PHODC|nr:probable serine/threonine-protein kinase At1g54610 isoform X1 [Phoenix dactylifera]
MGDFFKAVLGRPNFHAIVYPAPMIINSFLWRFPHTPPSTVEEAMGCVQAKPSSPSSPSHLEARKHVYGYDAGGGPAAKRQQHRAAPHRPYIRGREERTLTREGEKESKSEAVPPPSKPAGRGGGPTDEQVDGWPRWLTDNIPRAVLAGLVPRSADSYEKLDKVGQGTYSNVYKARDRDTGKIVALKKVRFDTSESESVKFMAREIRILQKLDHPNVIKLEGLATSRMQYSLYLVFDFMQYDLARVISRTGGRLTEPQVKCYMQQLLSGLLHCHERGILHRDIKGSNLLIDKHGVLKIADFGLANYFNPNNKQPLTSRVVTLWYRAPELLLGTTDYGIGIDLWSAGCLLAEMFAGRPILPGRSEGEQLDRIFKLCGSPPEDYSRKLKLSTSFRPAQTYKPTVLETFKDFPSSALRLLTILLALDPSCRGTAASALQSEFFTSSPLACDISGLPVIYNEENDEPAQPRERQKRKGSKLNHRSRTQKDNQKNMEQTIVKTKADSGSSKEEEKAADRTTRSQELDYSTGSTSSGVKPRVSVAPPASLSPVTSSVQGQSCRTEGHPSASGITRNLPPPPSMKANAGGEKECIDGMHPYGSEKRSASTSEFRRLDGQDTAKHYVLVD